MRCRSDCYEISSKSQNNNIGKNVLGAEQYIIPYFNKVSKSMPHVAMPLSAAASGF